MSEEDQSPEKNNSIQHLDHFLVSGMMHSDVPKSRWWERLLWWRCQACGKDNPWWVLHWCSQCGYLRGLSGLK